ncbi:MAG: PDZ domain-containing protein [Gammaproteobacteria bacterium]|nr:PDZ domain-containing protein [Gammaproteobacteria bacterium]MYC25570.1 PDZ domain-containing protein [Gammaproteobacteria bacterium]
MKTLRQFAMLTLLVIGLNGVAKDDDESDISETSQTADATKEYSEKLTLVEEAQAALEEKQKAFDARAADLRAARSQLAKESAILREATERERLLAAKSSRLTAQRLEPLVQTIANWIGPSSKSASPSKGYIGVLLGEASNNGVPIVEAFKGSSSYIAGVQAGDVILSVGGVKLTNVDDPIETTLALISSYKPGSIIQLTLRRDAKEMKVDVATTGRNIPIKISPPSSYINDPRAKIQQYQDGVIGVLLGEATDTGVPIQEVYEATPADIAGIQADDEILAIGKIELADLDNPTAFAGAFLSLKQPGSIIQLTIKRARKKEDVSVAVIDRNPYAATGKSYIGVLLGAATDTGVPIVEAYKGSSSYIAGVQAGDVIQSVDSVKLTNVDDPIATALALVSSYKPGSIIQLTLLRDAKEMGVEVATTALNIPDKIRPFSAFINDPRSKMQQYKDGVIGVLLGEATDTGVPIQEVHKSAPADIAGIQADDEILAIGKIELANLDNPTAFTGAFIELQQPGSIIHLTIKRDHKKEDVSVAVIDRGSLKGLTSFTRSWAPSIGYVTNPESVSFAGVVGGPTQLLKGLSTDNKIFVMEIEEEFGDYFNVEYGVLVLKAEDVAGVQAGDILLEIDEKPVRSLSQAFRHKQDADDEVEILLKRNKREKTVTLDKDKFSLHAILE